MRLLGNSLFLLIIFFLLANEVHSATPQCRDAHAYPDGVGIERAGVGVVALTRLAGRLVQVENNSDACHEEQEEHYPELLDALLT